MIHYNNYKLPPGLEYVGDGFTIRKTALINGKWAFEFMRELCNHLIAHPDPMIVPVSCFEFLGLAAGNVHKYSYDMMRLGDLSRKEVDIIWQVGDAWRHFHGYPNLDPTKQFKDDAVYSAEECWEQHPKLMLFLKEVIVLNRYHDLHGENVMMDNDGDYRLVDIEGFLNSPLSQPENDWLRQKKE